LSEVSTTVCPYCRSGFEPEDVVQTCPACGTPHHADCFAENGGCTIFGCTAAPADEAKVSVTPTDFRPPSPVAAPNTSFYNLNTTPPVDNQPAHALPPPMPPGSIAPPPPPTAIGYYPPTYSMTGMPLPQSYAYNSYVKPKSRVAFVLLAVFLGSFGAHNFYAGYTRKAVIQLLITICTCFWASLLTWIWAIVEACTVNTDDDGVLLN
jgi:TM2 domain-containing membrane protein YozV